MDKLKMTKTRVINIRLTECQRLELEYLAEVMQTTLTAVLLKGVECLKEQPFYLEKLVSNENLFLMKSIIERGVNNNVKR